MASTLFPIQIDNKVPPTSTGLTTTPVDPTYGNGHAECHIFEISAVEALETKVGINGSSDNTSVDFKLSHLDPAHNDVAASERYVSNTITGFTGTATAAVAGTTKLSSNPNQLGNPIALNANEVSLLNSAANLVPRGRNGSGTLDASFGGSAGSLATLNGSSLVVQNPANASSIPGASKIPIADGSGTLNAWANAVGAANVIPLSDSLGTLNAFVPVNGGSFVANSSINAFISPQAVYLVGATGKIDLLNASSLSEAAFAFIGFVGNGQNISSSGSAGVQYGGIISGFSSLSIGSFYYSQNTGGSIGLTAGSASIIVGKAVSATQLLIVKGKKVTNGVTSFSSTTTSAISCGFTPTKISIYAVATIQSTMSQGGWDITGGNNCVWIKTSSTSAVGNSTNAWEINDNAGNTHLGVVTNITATGFTLSNTKAGSPTNVTLFWQAEE